MQRLVLCSYCEITRKDFCHLSLSASDAYSSSSSLPSHGHSRDEHKELRRTTVVQNATKHRVGKRFRNLRAAVGGDGHLLF